MIPEPKKIKINAEQSIKIDWDDGTTTSIGLQELRDKCPCATCLADKSKQSQKYIPIYNRNQISVNEIKLIGSYAVNIIWKDGHNTGIYEFASLHRMAEIKA